MKCIKDIRLKTIKILEENIGKISLIFFLALVFLDITPKAQTRKAKTNQKANKKKKPSTTPHKNNNNNNRNHVGLHQAKKFLYNKREDQQNKKETYGTGEYVYKPD